MQISSSCKPCHLAKFDSQRLGQRAGDLIYAILLPGPLGFLKATSNFFVGTGFFVASEVWYQLYLRLVLADGSENRAECVPHGILCGMQLGSEGFGFSEGFLGSDHPRILSLFEGLYWVLLGVSQF